MVVSLAEKSVRFVADRSERSEEGGRARGSKRRVAGSVSSQGGRKLAEPRGTAPRSVTRSTDDGN